MSDRLLEKAGDILDSENVWAIGDNALYYGLRSKIKDAIEQELAEANRKVGEVKLATIERFLVNFPEALAELRSLPDVSDAWFDYAYGVTPALMVRYDKDDPKTERVRLTKERMRTAATDKGLDNGD